ncbi:MULTISPECIES: hypothetical protein [unclassified Mesorhizobium]|nr:MULTISPECIES: hypothetical protein [unclassified Mesorhizobium]
MKIMFDGIPLAIEAGDPALAAKGWLPAWNTSTGNAAGDSQ